MGSYEYEYHLLKITSSPRPCPENCKQKSGDDQAFEEFAYILEKRDDGRVRVIKEKVLTLLP